MQWGVAFRRRALPQERVDESGEDAASTLASAMALVLY